MTRSVHMADAPLIIHFSTGITRLNIPDICFLDGASGLHIGYLQTQYPSENGVAATWNRQLTTRRAVAMGEEFRKAGVSFFQTNSRISDSRPNTNVDTFQVHNALGPV